MVVEPTAVERELSAGTKFGYRPEFDGLRGVAIIGVIVFHYFKNWFRGSIIGVDLFFVLSGFLITRLLFEEKQRYGQISLRNFFAKRVGRLVPGAVLLVLVIVPAGVVVLDPPHPRNLLWGALGALTFTTNWLRIGGLDTDNLAHLWSMAIEQQFYVIWPFVVLLLGVSVRKVRNLCAVVMVLASLNILVRSLLGEEFRNLFDGLDTHGALMLLTGALLAMVLPTSPVLAARQRLLTALLVIGIALRTALVVVPDMGLYEAMWGRGGIQLTALISVVVILATKELNWLRPLLSGKWLGWLGRIAYSLFIWHQPVRDYFFPRLIHMYWLSNLFHFVVSVGVAAGSYYIVEQPLRQRIIQRFGDPARRSKSASADS